MAVHAETLAVASEALAIALEHGDWRAACTKFLQHALNLTHSESGFLGIVIADTLRVLAHDGIDWDQVDDQHLFGNVLRLDGKAGYREFIHFNNLFGHAITNDEVVIALPDHEEPPADRTGSNPPLHSFLAVPILAGQRAHGVIALANRAGGYSAKDQRRIETLVCHAGALCSSYRRHAAAQILEQQRLAAETSDAQLRRIAGHTARLGGWTVDLPEQKLVWSDEVCVIHDLPPGHTPTMEEGLGYFPPEVRTEIMRCMEVCATDGTSYDLELPKFTAAGRSIWVRCIGEAVRDQNGRIIRLQGAFQDITERRRIAEALRESEERLRQSQKMEAIGRLAGGIAHDFNNLLTVINGYSENILELAEITPLLQDSARMINEAGTRAAVLTRQLLGFSRQSTLQLQVLDLNTVVLETGSLLRRLIGEDIRFSTVLSPALSRVRADAGQMEQVLRNLALNARDAMPDGGKVTIATANVEVDKDSATLHPGCKPGPYVMLTMTDSGVGMTPTVLARSFEPFFTTKGVGEGPGLGLALVFGIVEQSGGWIQATSEPGRGTTFSIYMPALENSSNMRADTHSGGN